MIEVLKVSSKSNPNSVAGALAGVVRTSGSAEIQVVGAGALNQAIKAVAIARGYMAPSGQDLTCRPTFADIRIDGESRTAIRLEVECCAARTTAAQPVGAWTKGHPVTGLDGSGPDHSGPDHSGPDHLGPDHSGPDHLGPGHSGPDHLGPDHSGPDHMEPDPSGPTASS